MADNATSVRQAIEKLDHHNMALMVHHTGLLNQILRETTRRVGRGRGSSPVKAAGSDGASLIDSLRDLHGGLSRLIPPIGQISHLFQPLASSGAMLARVAGGAAQAGGSAAAGAAASAAGGAAGGAAAAGGGIAALASNPVGWAIALVAAAALVTAAFLALPSATAKFLDSLLDSNRGLAEVSSSMAAVLAKSDFRNIMRDIKKGEALAPSASKLADALAELKDSTLDLEITFGKIVNALGVDIAGFAEMISGAIKIVWGAAGINPGRAAQGWEDVKQGLANMDKASGMLIDIVKGIDAKMPGDSPEPMADFFNRVAGFAQDAQARNDPRFGRVQLAR